jgi:acetyltransferase-like isoleucine patch superfamily enzyme
MNRAHNFLRDFSIRWWTWKFKRHCHPLQGNIRVEGPCVVFGGGKLHILGSLVIRSRKHLPVEIYLKPGASLTIGPGSFINQGVRISCSKEIRIGKGCLVADECLLLDNDYHELPGQENKIAPVILEDGVWLASRVIVLRGVTIGKGSVIGAGSVVTRSIPAHTFAAGSPARPVKSLLESFAER